MKRGMTTEYQKCRTDLNFEVDFEVNGAIGAIVTKWDLIVFLLYSFSSIITVVVHWRIEGGGARGPCPPPPLKLVKV